LLTRSRIAVPARDYRFVGVAIRAIVVAALATGCGRFHFDPLATDADRTSDGASDSSADARAAPTMIYADTYPNASKIYTIDPVTLQPSGGTTLCTNIGSPDVGDILFDASGQLIAFGFTQLSMYRVELDFATCTAIPLTYQGVQTTSTVVATAVVPAGGVGPNLVVLGASQDSKLYQINTTDGTMQLITNLAAGASGDLVWTGTELLMTTAPGGNDHLVRVNMTTGALTDIGATGFGAVFGLAWLNGTLYAMSNGGQVAIIDPSTAATVRSINTADGWGGATVR
jgi:hypothetical protein